jgi:AcrR family transcriptional regulator
MTTGLRERKKERTRQQLAQVALELFDEKGFGATTIDDIAGACDVSVRTFFRYFASKEDVLFADSDDRLQRLLAALSDRPPAESPMVAIRAAFGALVADYKDGREWMVRRHRILKADEHLRNRAAERQASWEDALAGVLRARPGKAIPPLELQLIVGAATTAMRAASRVWADGGGRGDLPKLIDEAFDRLMRGLGTDP